MRAALLIAGQPRTFEFCFPSLQRHLLDVYCPDIFICTNDQEARMRELYKPVAMEVIGTEECIAQGTRLREGFGHPDMPAEAGLSVGYKFLRCTEMKREFEKKSHFVYDVVMISRFDVKFAHIQPIGHPAENVIYVPLVDAYPVLSDPVPGLHWGGYSGHLCWMSSQVVDLLPQIYFSATNWLQLATGAKAQWGQNPEHVLKYFCDKNGIRAKFVQIQMMLIRGSSEAPLGYDHQPISIYPEFA